MQKSFFILCIFILGMANSGHSQNFQWIKQIGDKHGESGSKCKILPDGRSIVSWYFADSTKIDAFKPKFKKSSVPGVVSFLSKAGKAMWVWTPDSTTYHFIVSSICYSQSLSKIFICGNFKKKATINNITYTGEHNGFILRLDTNGNFEKIYALSNPDQFSFEIMEISESNEIFLGVQLSNSNSKLSIPEVGFLITKQGYFMLKLDKELVPKMASEPVYGMRWGRLAMSLSSSNTILNAYSFIDTAIIGGKIYFNGKGKTSSYITYLDSNLKVKKNALLFTTQDNYASIYCIKSFNDGSILLGGTYTDSISLIPKKYYDNRVPLFACLDSNLKLKWYKSPEIKKGEKVTGEILDMNIIGDYIYVGGAFGGNTVYREFNLPNGEGFLWFFKADKLGNILWMNKIGKANYYQPLSGISASKQGEILLSGMILDSAYLNNKVYITEKGRPDVLLMKINDIDIIRGFVKSGPYCAGDTIKIPYTKNGTFNKGNQFIAQLSDENGNFEGKERELGRITSDTNATIKGLLPFFNVESSPLYRIRILSTSPVVQSYYKYDTLRLLIYSKDTANAGKDTTICLGQTVKLSTTGGSRWRWSPGNLVSDSTAKTTAAMPLITTKYRIIISDSSGCGKIDTAYKIITIRPPMKIKGLPKDTIVCKDKRVFLKMVSSGGLSSGYIYQWLSSFNQQLGTMDTLSIKVSTPGSIKAVLSDGCTIMNDTVVINFGFQISNFSQLLKDTLVCKNSEPILKLMPSNGLSSDYSYQWFSDFKLLANTDTLRYKISKPETFKAILTHTCSGKQYTSLIKLILPPPIAAKIEKPDCFDSSVILKITGTGGYKNSLNYVWYKNGKAIDIGKTTPLSHITKKQWIEAYTTDFCKTTVKDSVLLFPNPKARLLASTDSVCQFQTIELHNQSVQFNAIQSALNGFRWKNKDSSLTHTETGQQTISLQITDSLGCKSNASVSLMVIEKPNAQFVIIPENPTVDNGTIELTPLETNYKKYNWAIGDNLRLYHKLWQSVRLPILDTATYPATLMVSNTFGCADTVTKLIKIGVSDAFYIPNAVSNNEDGLNDEFAPFGWKVESYTMLVVARTNQVVYKGNSPWKPTYEDGVYSYVIKVKFKDGTENTFKGHVHVIH